MRYAYFDQAQAHQDQLRGHQPEHRRGKLISLLYDWALVDAGVLIRTGVFSEVVDVHTSFTGFDFTSLTRTTIRPASTLSMTPPRFATYKHQNHLQQYVPCQCPLEASQRAGLVPPDVACWNPSMHG